MRSVVNSKIRAIIWELAENGGTTSKEIILAFKEKHPELVKSIETELVDRSLRRLINDVSQAKDKSYMSDQAELFRQYPSLPAIIVTRKSRGKAAEDERRRFDDLTVPELIEWYDKRTRPRRQESRYPDVPRLIEKLGAYRDDHKTPISVLMTKELT